MRYFSDIAESDMPMRLAMSFSVTQQPVISIDVSVLTKEKYSDLEARNGVSSVYSRYNRQKFRRV